MDKKKLCYSTYMHVDVYIIRDSCAPTGRKFAISKQTKATVKKDYYNSIPQESVSYSEDEELLRPDLVEAIFKDCIGDKIIDTLYINEHYFEYMQEEMDG